MTDPDDILEIDMQSVAVDCALCGRPTDIGWGVPVYNGDVVSTDFPDWMYARSGGCVSVCRDCHARHERGEVPTFDHYYVPRTLMGVELLDGGGI